MDIIKTLAVPVISSMNQSMKNPKYDDLPIKELAHFFREIFKYLIKIEFLAWPAYFIILEVLDTNSLLGHVTWRAVEVTLRGDPPR